VRAIPRIAPKTSSQRESSGYYFPESEWNLLGGLDLGRSDFADIAGDLNRRSLGYEFGRALIVWPSAYN
jgi:hypothetical protein